MSWLPGEGVVFDEEQRRNIATMCADLQTLALTGQLPCFVRAVSIMNWLNAEIAMMTEGQMGTTQ